MGQKKISRCFRGSWKIVFFVVFFFRMIEREREGNGREVNKGYTQMANKTSVGRNK